MQPSPSFDIKYQHNVLSSPASSGQVAQVPYHRQPLTPPLSGEHEHPNQLLSASCMPIMPTIEHQPASLTSNSIETDPIAWNPSRIFEYDLVKHKVKSSTNKLNSQWNTAFGSPNGLDSTRTVPMPQPSPPLYTSSTIGSHELPSLHDAMRPQTQQYSVQSSIAPIPTLREAPAVMSQPSYNSPSPSFVTSSMWRDTVANTYDPGGQKRRWEVDTNFLVDLTQPKGLKWPQTPSKDRPKGSLSVATTPNFKAACSLRGEPTSPPLPPLLGGFAMMPPFAMSLCKRLV